MLSDTIDQELLNLVFFFYYFIFLFIYYYIFINICSIHNFIIILKTLYPNYNQIFFLTNEVKMFFYVFDYDNIYNNNYLKLNNGWLLYKT